MTLADLRALLEHAHGPAVERLEDRTIKGIAVVYLPRWLEWTWAPGVGIDTDNRGPYPTHIMLVTMHQNGAQQANLTDPGTVHAVKVALALALGLDPGAHGEACMWLPDRGVVSGSWQLSAYGPSSLTAYTDHGTTGASFRAHPSPSRKSLLLDLLIHAPEVAAEQDPIKAIVLACQHVIKEKA